MTERPYELLARFRPDGSIAGVHVRTIVTVGGRDYECDPTPLADSKDPAFTAFAAQFAAGVVAENESLKSQNGLMQGTIGQQERELIDWQLKASELESRLNQVIAERVKAIESHESISAKVVELQNHIVELLAKVADLEKPKDPPTVEFATNGLEQI